MKEMGVEEKIKQESKTLDQLREIGRQLHDELCWGNRKDIGTKFPRTPLTPEECSIKSKEYHAEGWVKVNDVLKELGVASKEIQLERDNALEWVKETILKESYEECGRDTTGLDFEAAGMCHAIQVFVDRKLLGLLVEHSKEDKKDEEI